jgi:hypothetical protein
MKTASRPFSFAETALASGWFAGRDKSALPERRTMV